MKSLTEQLRAELEKAAALQLQPQQAVAAAWGPVDQLAGANAVEEATAAADIHQQPVDQALECVACGFRPPMTLIPCGHFFLCVGCSFTSARVGPAYYVPRN